MKIQWLKSRDVCGSTYTQANNEYERVTFTQPSVLLDVWNISIFIIVCLVFYHRTDEYGFFRIHIFRHTLIEQRDADNKQQANER